MKLLNKLHKLDLDKSKKYLLACSCGPDSMALLAMLKAQKFNFEVAFVNYKTRTNSDDEEKTLEEYCLKNNIKLFKLILQEPIVKNFEEEARKVRYDFFRSIVIAQKEEIILLTAHHADDVIETFTMNESKGKLTKYAGIAEISSYKEMKIIHPLLSYEKKLLVEYCENNNIPYSIDYTNFEEIHDRNIVRKISETFSFETKERIINTINEINVKLETLYKELAEVKLYETLEISSFKNEKEEIALRMLFFLIDNLSKSIINGAVLKDFYRNIVLNDGVTNYILELDNDYILIKEYDELRFLKSEDLDKKLDLTLEEAKEKLGLNIEKAQELGATKVVSLSNFKHFTKNNEKFKTNRFFISCKMPISIRNLWPALVNNKNEVVYTPRYNKNYLQKEDSIFNFKIEDLY